MNRYYGYCNRCGSEVSGFRAGKVACKWGRCNGEAILQFSAPSNKRLHTDAGESTVKIGSLTPEEDSAIKADNKPAQRG